MQSEQQSQFDKYQTESQKKLLFNQDFSTSSLSKQLEQMWDGNYSLLLTTVVTTSNVYRECVTKQAQSEQRMSEKQDEIFCTKL